MNCAALLLPHPLQPIPLNIATLRFFLALIAIMSDSSDLGLTLDQVIALRWDGEFYNY